MDNANTIQHANEIRTHLKQHFLKQHNLENAPIEMLPADASFRTYSRITLDNTSYLLMDSPPDKEPIDNFIKIDEHLKNLGFSAPTIIAKDALNGFLLLEDFGDNTFSRLLHSKDTEQGHTADSLYTLATETLISMHQNTMMTALNAHPYDMATYLREVNLFIEWFYPALMEKNLTFVEKSKWERAWVNDLGKILPTRSTLVLRDFHAGNLMLLEGRNGVDSCGLLDFQDALIGHPSYDLLSLLEDVRLDIAPSIEKKCLAHYKNITNAGEDFDMAYTLLSAQRHAKVLGIFVRLKERDCKGNYLQYLPRTAMLFNRAIQSGIPENVKKWIEKYMPNLKENLQGYLESNT